MSESVFMWISIISVTLLVIISVVSMITGSDGAGEADYDIDSETGGFLTYVFSTRSVLGFFAGYGLGGLKAINDGHQEPIFLALSLGLGFMAVVGLVMFGLSKAKTREYVSLSSAIGNTGMISIPIAEGSIGKISVTVGEALREVEAKSKSNISYGLNESTVVIDIEDNILVVK